MDPKPEDLPTAKAVARLARRRWIRRGVLVLALVGALVQIAVGLAPGIVQDVIASRLAERLQAEVEIDDVEIGYSRLLVEIRGLRLDGGQRLQADIAEVDVDFSWLALFRRDVRPSIVVRDARVAVVVDQTAEPGEPQDDPRLDAFESLEIVDGSLEITLITHSGPSQLSLGAIQAHLETPITSSASSQMGTHLRAEASVGQGGRLELNGQVSSEAPRRAWRLRFSLTGLQVADLNNLWRDIIEMDAEAGTLSLKGELLRSAEHLRGRVTPKFESLIMLGESEEAAHPMAEALFGHMLASANSAIDVNRTLDDANAVTFTQLLVTDWKTLIAGMIRNGYSRRLGTLDNYDATIGEVEVDFAMGLLTLLDVSLVHEAARDEAPFVVVPRIDVLFDPQVREHGARAYKHVTLWEPTLTFVAGAGGSGGRLKFDENWVDKISAIPFKTRNLIVHGGRIEYRDFRGEEPIVLFVSDIELAGKEMAADLHAPGVRGARLSGSGRVLGETVASIDVAYAPRAEPPNIDLDLLLLPLPLPALNALLREYAQVEAAKGQLGFSTHITARDLHVEASVHPDIAALALQRPANAGRGHGLRHVILERRLERLRGHVIDLSYDMEPGEGVLHQFFPQFLMAAIRE